MSITAIYWNSNNINNLVITSIAIFGIVTMIQVVNNLTHDFYSYGVWFIVLLGSAITAAVFFAMILGHWYLNVVAFEGDYGHSGDGLVLNGHYLEDSLNNS